MARRPQILLSAFALLISGQILLSQAVASNSSSSQQQGFIDSPAVSDREVDSILTLTHRAIPKSGLVNYVITGTNQGGQLTGSEWVSR